MRKWEGEKGPLKICHGPRWINLGLCEVMYDLYASALFCLILFASMFLYISL